MPPFPQKNGPYPGPQQGMKPKKPSILSQFQTEEGKFDIDKITTTAQQAKQIYDSVGPIVTKFLKK